MTQQVIQGMWPYCGYFELHVHFNYFHLVGNLQIKLQIGVDMQKLLVKKTFSCLSDLIELANCVKF